MSQNTARVLIVGEYLPDTEAVSLEAPDIQNQGAGVGGLSLAHGLAKHGIKVTVFEKDLSSGFRSQGYRFRMNPNGSTALKSMLSDDLFAQFEQTAAAIRIGGTRMKYDGTVLHCQEGAEGGFLKFLLRKPSDIAEYGVKVDPKNGSAVTEQYGGVYTVDRTLFRAILLQNLDVQFGRQAIGYALDSPSPGKVTLQFKDGSSETGDFLVGADGLRSVVGKQLLPKHLPVDTTGRCIYGKTAITPQFLEKFPKQMHDWMSMTIDDTGAKPVCLLTEPFRFSDAGKALSSTVLPQPSEDYMYWVLAGSPAITEKWSPAIRSVLEFQTVDQTVPLRLCSVVPEIPYWTPSPLLTLVGDAVHVMSPTGGVGANTALRDSAALCGVLRKAFGENQGKVSAEAIGQYEADYEGLCGQSRRYVAAGRSQDLWSAAVRGL
ncbi:FAD/NAD(P)-binding domain-containing protein [Gymnopus androsaceus JB14]|uniref:FAD/NAD(P)-binding domain-containing protein n=1 Tax=Gymnopus androsaceus JB14 TaxID=1447944 RepID=A0A6A4IL62_9AGAR|nr:FAD/NAD(P)-binding domain-containing protein [Gymnopus androsaceus JB14]